MISAQEKLAEMIFKKINGQYFTCRRQSAQTAREIAEDIVKELKLEDKIFNDSVGNKR